MERIWRLGRAPTDWLTILPSFTTLMVVKEGKIVNQSVGARPKRQILSML